MREEYGKLDKVEMSIWECCELLNDVIDDSDPDLDEPQIEHLLQTAEAIRKDYPDEDWLHLTGLIHGMSYIPDLIRISLTTQILSLGISKRSLRINHLVHAILVAYKYG